MPPKVKIPREAIIEKAFELTKAYGFEKVTARLLASELKCSTQPVFHAFRNMEELKEEVYKKTQKLFEETMLQHPSDTETPYFLSMGLKYVELAQNEKICFSFYVCQIAEQDLKAFTIWLSTFLFRLNRKCL
ncbi:MAG: TetR/AcrR family transcriptional regulator [Blautia marasmi]